MDKLLFNLFLAFCICTAQAHAAKEHKYRGNASKSRVSESGAGELELDSSTTTRTINPDTETGQRPDSDQEPSAGASGSPLLAHAALPVPRHGFPNAGFGGAGLGSGILDKSAPDLQFGLALTIPFVSLATEKLLHSFGGGHGHGGGYGHGNAPRSFRSWSDIAQLLKLNVGGLVLAAVVGVAALIFLPTIFHGRGGVLKGFGSNLFENLIQNGVGGGLNKHFGYGQYEHHGHGGYDSYGPGFAGQQGWDSGKFGGYGKRKESRDLKDGEAAASSVNGSATATLWSSLASTVHQNLPELTECSLYAMCVQGMGAGSSNTTGTEVGGLPLAASALGQMNEYAGRLEEAFNVGRNASAGAGTESDCAAAYSRCDRIPKLIDRVGKYIFGD